MKEHILVNTHNIEEGDKCLEYLLNRQPEYQVGLGTLTGFPGLGKTKWAMRTAIRENYIYMSAKKADTRKGFIQSLCQLLNKRYFPNKAVYASGSRSKLFNLAIDILNQNTTREHMPVIIIDEADNVLHEPHEGIIGMLRDIVDNTAAIVILIGMDEFRAKLMKLNAHYYKRVAYFADFEPLSDNDITSLCREICEVTLDVTLIKHTIAFSKGDARNVIKQIRNYEEIAHYLQTEKLDLNTWLRTVNELKTQEKGA